MLSILITKGSPWVKGNLIKVTHAEPCTGARRAGERRTTLRADKHLNSALQVINQCQYGKRERRNVHQKVNLLEPYLFSVLFYA